MGLVQNGYRDRGTGDWYAGAGFSNGAYPAAHHNITHLTGRNRNLTAGEGITDDKVGAPVGATHPVAWVLPQKPGLISARAQAINVTASGAALAGYPIEGSTEISVTIADAEGQLISSGEGSATLSITVADLLLTASLNAIGQAEISLTVADATLGAEASLTGSSTFAVTGSLTPYAIGHMTGSALPYTELSPQSLADAVLGAAANSPIYANIKQVNDVTVNGTGQAGAEWGP